MRFMMFMYPEISEEAWEGGPSAEEAAAMNRYNEELRKAGMLLALDGLQPPAEGGSVSFDGE
ncbi:MAG TPA: YciI family protein, partial [Solirubrobacterales bacterium]|nr:YciI family protein [Solirubrobacterales bacterium]